MTGKLIVTFDKSQEDIPTLVVSKEGWSIIYPSMEITNVFTGKKAESLWRKLTQNESDGK